MKKSNGVINIKISKYKLALFSIFIIWFLLCIEGLNMFFYDNSTSFDKLSFIGSLLGTTIVLLSILIASKQIDYQLKEGRKNNFDVSIAVENYKKYFNYSNECTKYNNDIRKYKNTFLDKTKDLSNRKNLRKQVSIFNSKVTILVESINNNFKKFEVIQEYYEKNNHRDRLIKARPIVDNIEKSKNNMIKISSYIEGHNVKGMSLQHNIDKYLNYAENINECLDKLSIELINVGISLIDSNNTTQKQKRLLDVKL